MVVNILTCIFEALLITMVFNAYGTDDSSKRTWRFGVLSVVFLSCIIALSNAIVSMSFLNLILIGCGIALAGYIYTKNTVRSLVMAVLLVFLFSMSEIITVFIISAVMKIDVAQAVSDENYRLLGILLSKILTFVILKLVCYRRKNLILEFKMPYWILFVSVFLALTVTINLMFLLRYNSQAEMQNTMVVFCSIGLLYIAFLIMHIIEKMSFYTSTIVEREKRNTEMQEQIFIKEKEKKEADMLMRFRHDYKIHEIALKAYLDKGEIEEAKNHIDKMSEFIDSYDNSAGLN